MKTHHRHQTALLLIDVINALDFENSGPMIDAALPAAKNIAALKHRAARAGIPVIYVNDNWGLWREDFRQTIAHCGARTKPGAPIVRLLRPTKSDYFVLKPMHSGFFNTSLDPLLRSLGTKRVILTGFAGNICVLFTAADAYMRELRIVVATDCIASTSPAENETAIRHMRTVLKARTLPSPRIKLAS